MVCGNEGFKEKLKRNFTEAKADDKSIKCD